jgi:hypothetical protein
LHQKSQSRQIPLAPSDAGEKALVRVSTRGVVRLFNAIISQQKQREAAQVDEIALSAAKGREVERQSRGEFLDLLKGKAAGGDGSTDAAAGAGGAGGGKSAADKSWLADDYLLGAKINDWKDDASGGEGDDDADSD